MWTLFCFDCKHHEEESWIYIKIAQMLPLCPHPPLELGGTSRFTGVSRHPNMCWHPTEPASTSVPEFVYVILLAVFCRWLSNSFRDLCSIFNITGVIMLQQILCLRNISGSFPQWLSNSQIWYM